MGGKTIFRDRGTGKLTPVTMTNRGLYRLRLTPMGVVRAAAHIIVDDIRGAVRRFKKSRSGVRALTRVAPRSKDLTTTRR